MVSVHADGVIFAKNSDRDANESQVLSWVASADHDVTVPLACTWTQVDQVAHTNAVILSRPWWMWGAEMGANEHGVVIGNEAVFTNAGYGDDALLGMDLLRLALERARSAHEAVSVMVALLERYGQGGSCSYERPDFTYHNSFLVADRAGAYVLETAGRHWASEEVRSGVRAISNGLTIDGFAQQYTSRVRSSVSGCRIRRARSESLMGAASDVADVFAALRDHGDSSGPTWSSVNGSLHAPCVHAGGLVASSQTTASLVADLRDAPTYWATATAAPCTSLFKPVRIDDPVDVGAPTNRFDPYSLWWRHERLHRRALRDFSRCVTPTLVERDRLEAQWLADPPSSRDAFSAGDAFEQGWNARLDERTNDVRPWFVRRAWRALDDAADVRRDDARGTV